jgi:hypothetical protein
MVKQQKKHSKKKRFSKGFKANSAETRRINASTGYDTCTVKIMLNIQEIDKIILVLNTS